MTAPFVHEFPVRRPGYITNCEWVGPDNQLQLQVNYYDETNAYRQIKFDTRHIADATKGEVCLPNSTDLTNLGARYEDILMAHTRMACMVSRSGIPGSTEFNDALMSGPSANLNTALGTVKVMAITPVSDQTVTLTYRCSSGGPTLDIVVDYRDLNNYSFVPDTQLFVIPGAIKKQFPTYVHDYPNTILSQARRDEIAAYVLTLAPWI